VHLDAVDDARGPCLGTQYSNFVAAPDEERGQIVKAYVVLRAGMSGDAAMTKTLQDHVKATVAPYKYPRAIEFVAELPKTQTGKLQRFELRRRAAEGASRKLAS
jgi:2-aminobenzoate-CoA ligase